MKSPLGMDGLISSPKDWETVQIKSLELERTSYTSYILGHIMHWPALATVMTVNCGIDVWPILVIEHSKY